MSDQEASSSPFETIRHTTDADAKYWSARELTDVLEYALWQNFVRVIRKAKVICEGSGQAVSDHFIETSLPVAIGSGATRELEDYALSRYAFCLVLI